MQQFLSYQQAMRINNDERDVRAYISKRTCVSLILSIAFSTLVIGYLLGKFYTNRQYRVKQMLDPPVIKNIRQIPLLKQQAAIVTKFRFDEKQHLMNQGIIHINDYDESSEVPLVLPTSIIFTSLSNNNSRYLESQLRSNKKIWDQMLRCQRPIDLNLNGSLSVFVGRLIDSEVDRLQNCLIEIENVLKKLNSKK